jgi:hypothetical protein
MTHKQYFYVGSKPKSVQQLLRDPSPRSQITAQGDVVNWLRNRFDPESFTATFIIDVNEQLWIADQRSEHIVCARGEAVLAAGEITFTIDQGIVRVVEITNQSTGYCPEPESWDVVAAVLDQTGMQHPRIFTMICVFRRCITCSTTNIIKEELYECAVCGSPLSRTWNYGKTLGKKYL